MWLVCGHCQNHASYAVTVDNSLIDAGPSHELARDSTDGGWTPVTNGNRTDSDARGGNAQADVPQDTTGTPVMSLLNPMWNNQYAVLADVAEQDAIG